MRVKFYVQKGEIVSGLKYVQKTYRKGLKGEISIDVFWIVFKLNLENKAYEGTCWGSWLATFPYQFSTSSIPGYIFLPIRSKELNKLTRVLLVIYLKTTIVIKKIYKGIQKNVIFQKMYNFVMDFQESVNLSMVSRKIYLKYRLWFSCVLCKNCYAVVSGASNYNSTENERYFL